MDRYGPSEDLLNQHGFKDWDHFHAVSDSLHNRGLINKPEIIYDMSHEEAIPFVAHVYRESARKGLRGSSTARRPMNVTMATGKVRPRPGENQDAAWGMGEGYTSGDSTSTGNRLVRQEVDLGLMRLDNPDQFWSRPSTQERPGRFPMVDQPIHRLNEVYQSHIKTLKEAAVNAHKEFLASKVNTQGKIDYASRLYEKHKELLEKRKSGAPVTNEDIDAARRKYHAARGVAMLAIQEHQAKKDARNAAHQKVLDFGLPMSGDDMAKMAEQRLVKNVIRPDGVQQGEIERFHDVPEGVHLATSAPFKGYTGDLSSVDD